MTYLDDYNAILTQLNAEKIYATWRKDNPGEASRFDTYKTAILAGYEPSIPSMASPYGKRLILEGQMALHFKHADSPAPVQQIGQPIAPIGPFTVMDGGGTQSAAVDYNNPYPRTITKVQASNYVREGISQMAWPPLPSTGRSTVTDCIVDHVMESTPGSGNGTHEACYWFGQTVDAARLVAKNAGWMGIWVGAHCTNSTFTDLDVYVPRPSGGLIDTTGVYIEHAGESLKFTNSKIWATGNGFNIEWWYKDSNYAQFMPAATQAAYPGRAGAHNIEISYCTIHSEKGWGIFADAGVYNLNVHHCIFTGLNGIAYPDPAHRADPNGTIEIDWASCDTTGLSGTKVQVHQRAIG